MKKLRKWMSEKKLHPFRWNAKNIIIAVFSVLIVFGVFYAMMLPAITMQQTLICELEEHAHTEECYEDVLVCEDADEAHTHTEVCYEKMVTCTKPEHAHADTCYAKIDEASEKTFENDEVLIKVTIPEGAGIPENAKLKVETNLQKKDSEKYNELLALTQQSLAKNQTISNLKAYDISFQLSGEEIEPKKEVKVSMQFKKPIFDAAQIQQASELQLLHMVDAKVEKVDDANFVNTTEGVSDLEFSARSFSPYVVVLVDRVVTGTFYERVKTIDSTTANYILLPVTHSYVLADGAPNGAAPIDISPVKGHPTLYTISDETPVTNNMRLRFTSASGSSGTAAIQNVGTGKFLDSGSATFTTTSTNWSIEHFATHPEYDNVWRLHDDVKYLYNGNGTYFSINTTIYNSTRALSYSYRDFWILKEVTREITIPGDIEPEEVKANLLGTGAADETKPSYPAYINTSDKKSGADIIGGRDFYFASDKATSQIENDDIFNGRESDQGKIWADKSVIYMNDDYNAKASYADGEFGVTLSALAQQHVMEGVNTEKIPVDVVFVLDLSGSMSVTVNLGGKNEKRITTLVNSLNKAIDLVMKLNPQNRVGVVGYNSRSFELMSLDRYYVSSSPITNPNYDTGYQYVQITNKTNPESETNPKEKSDFLYSNPSLRRANGSTLSFEKEVFGSTYMQHGIHRGYEVFRKNTDTKYTLSNGTEISRQPVMIFLADGEPTVGTSNYTSPMDGSVFGNGVSESTDSEYLSGKGVVGYYTVLTANHFKSMIGIHYGRKAQVHTIGMGIYTKTEGGSTYADSAGGYTGDDLRRAVLDPSDENISILNNRPTSLLGTGHFGDIYSSDFGKQMRALLLNQFNKGGSPMSTARHVILASSADTSLYPRIGLTHQNIPVMPNPYLERGFAYADSAHFGQKMTDAQLYSFFSTIINNSIQETYVIPKELTNGSYLEFEDNIGAGMEIKGGITVRYQGTNYPCSLYETTNNPDGSVTRKYRTTADVSVTNGYGQSIKLRSMIITVTTASNGDQTLKWAFKEDLLPMYVRSKNGQFYFEMLPIRLIFTVGLRNSAQAQSNQPYYTNKQGSAATKVTFTPSTDNPYYKIPANTTAEFAKSENTTNTASTYFKAAKSGSSMTISLGNNGVLIPQEQNMNLNVKKVWKNPLGAEITDTSNLPQITVKLYRKVGANGTPEKVGSDVVLKYDFDPAYSWNYTWWDLESVDGNGAKYIYYVEEDVQPGSEYAVEYTNNAVSSDSASKQITITNKKAYTSIDVEKVWKINETIYVNTDPNASVVVYLYRKTAQQANGVPVTGVTNPVTLRYNALSAENSWKYRWTNLPRTDGSGNEYFYYVVENPVADHETKYQAGSGAILTDPEMITEGKITVYNTKIVDDKPTFGDITVKKSWQNQLGEPLPENETQQVQVTLKRRKGYVPITDKDDVHTVTVKIGTKTETFKVPNGGSALVSASYWGMTLDSTPFVGTPEGSYQLSSANATWTKKPQYTGTSAQIGGLYWYQFNAFETLSNITSDVTLTFDVSNPELVVMDLDGYGGVETKIALDRGMTWVADTFSETVTLQPGYWEHTCADLPATEVNIAQNRVYYYFYYVEELALEGFDVTYSENNAIEVDGNRYGEQNGVIEITNKRQAALSKLPETGGSGVILFTVGGISIMVLATAVYLWRRKRRASHQ